jgi:hypothetical protein
MFFAESLGKRTRRALYVTATPFSLSVEQLCERIDDMHVVTGASREEFMKLEKDLLRFRDIVKSRGQLPVAFKQGLEGQLRRYLVRSVWEPEIAPGILRRKQVPPPAVTMLGSEGQAYTMFALETAFLRLAEIGARTHSTAHRETLCSTYAAIRRAAKRSHDSEPTAELAAFWMTHSPGLRSCTRLQSA